MDDRWVDVAHEALIRNWTRLRGWIDDDRADLLAHRRVTESALEWRRLERDDSALYRGTKLTQALEWRDRNRDRLNDAEREFLDAGVALRGREEAARERRRWSVVAAAVVVLGIAVALLWQYRSAEEQRRRVTARELGEKARQEFENEDGSFLNAMLLAIESLNSSETPEAVTLIRRGMEVLSRPPLSSWRMGSQKVNALAFSPDGQWLAVGSEYNLVVREPASGTEIVRLPGLMGLRSLAFSPDGRWLVAGGNSGARVWKISSSTSWDASRSFSHGSFVWSVAFSPDSRRLATASYGSPVVKVFRGDHWQEESLLQPGGQVWAVAFSPDSVSLAASGGSVGLWSVSRLPVQQLIGKAVAVRALSLAFSNDGRLLATGDAGGGAELWERDKESTGDTLAEIGPRMKHGSSAFGAVAFSPDGRYLATGGSADGRPGNGTVRVWDVATHQEQIRIFAGVRAFAFSRDGQSLVTGDGRGTVAWWTLASGPEVARLATMTTTHAVTFDSDDKWVATASADDTVRVYETGTWTKVTSKALSREVRGVAFSADHRWLVARTDSSISVFDSRGWRSVYESPRTNVDTAAFSPDSKWLLTLSDTTVRLLKTVNWTAVAPIEIDGPFLGAALSPDGKWIATRVRTQLSAHRYASKTTVWDLATSRMVDSATSDDQALSHDSSKANAQRQDSLAFQAKTWPDFRQGSDSVTSSSGRWSVFVGRDGVVRVHALMANDLIAEACSRLAGTGMSDSFELRRVRACRVRTDR